jgi:Ca-activated chloride channel family protein
MTLLWLVLAADPYRAYDEGHYQEALQAFTDAQVERPEDPRLMFNLGAAHYRNKDYEAAGKAFGQAALKGDPALRAQALYNLGNIAFRTGKLEDAILRYQGALELSPDDADAKFNLEFVRDEIRRRHEEAQKQQQQQQGQKPDEQQGEKPDEQQGEKPDEQQGEKPDEQQGQKPDEQQGEKPDEQQGEKPDEQQGEKPDEQQGQAAGADTATQDQDGDGVADDTETSGKNPTDPHNPDSDGDGVADGREDKNKNGSVDAGETDPNKKDSDGDGVADADEPENKLSPEEAERYLQLLHEGLPSDPRRQGSRGRPVRPAKDW